MIDSLFGDDAERQGTSINPELKALIDEARKLEDEKESLSARTKEINKRLDDIGRSAHKMFEADGFPTFILDGYKISLDLKNCWSIHDKQGLISALETNPDTLNFVKKDFSKSALDKFLDEATLTEGKSPFADDLVSVEYVKPSVRFRKSR